MRGFAVIVMVMGHSLDSVLSVELRSTEAFRMYDVFRGFTAPMFLFVAGYAFMVATAKRWDEYMTFGKRVRKRLWKVVVLFLVGYALHAPFFSLDRLMNSTSPEQLAFFLQADVLQCVAVSLLILQIVLLLTPSRRTFTFAITGLNVFIVLATPIIWSIDFAPIVSPVFSPYFNQTQVSLFPIFPYAAYLFAGVIVGNYFLKAKEGNTVGTFVTRLSLAALGAILVAVFIDRLPLSFYPSHDFWKTSPILFTTRVGIIILLSTGFYLIKKLPDVLEKNLTMLGQASLLVYTVHLVVVYGSAMNYGLFQRVGQTLEAHVAFAVALAVLATMTILTYAWNYVKRNYFVPARIVQVGLASTLIYTFISRPF